MKRKLLLVVFMLLGAAAISVAPLFAQAQSAASDTTIVVDGYSHVVIPDIVASNGIIQGVDSPVNAPTSTEEATAEATESAAMTEAPMATEMAVPTNDYNIIQAMQANGHFTFALESLQLMGLDSLLEGPGPYTVFAPVDDAFEGFGMTYQMATQMPDMVKQALMQGGTKRDILYSIVSGNYMISDLRGMTSLPSLEGDSLTISVGPMPTPEMTAEATMGS